MKKVLSVLLVVLFVCFSFAGCGNIKEEANAASENSTSFTEELPTNKPTSKPTDPTTEPPTKKPTEKPTENPKEVEQKFKDSCEAMEYNDLARNPDKAFGTKVTVTGEVVQVIESDYSDLVHLRVDITKTSYGGYKDTVYIIGNLDGSGDRILEGDIITIWGACSGTHTYETVLGSSVTLPKIEMLYYSIEGAESQDSEQESKKTSSDKVTKKQEIKNDTSSDGFYAYGDGDYVASGLKVTGYAVLHVEYTGDRHFSIVSYDNGEYDDLLVNTTGYYSGDVLVDHSGEFELEINATGNWNITSSGLSIDDKTEFCGHGDSVTGITSSSGGNWEITHNGQRHFSVVEYGLNSGYMDLLANTTGEYSGTVKAEAGDNIFFEINADGDWTIKKI